MKTTVKAVRESALVLMGASSAATKVRDHERASKFKGFALEAARVVLNAKAAVVEQSERFAEVVRQAGAYSLATEAAYS